MWLSSTALQSGTCFVALAEAVEEGAREEATDGKEATDGGSRTFVRCARIVRVILTTKQAGRDQLTARKYRTRRVDFAKVKRVFIIVCG